MCVLVSVDVFVLEASSVRRLGAHTGRIHSSNTNTLALMTKELCVLFGRRQNDGLDTAEPPDAHWALAVVVLAISQSVSVGVWLANTPYDTRFHSKSVHTHRVEFGEQQNTQQQIENS